jgi:hypothetical protein
VNTLLTTVLFVASAFCLGTGLTAAASRRMPSWLAGQTPRPRFWGAGYALLGAGILYHAVARMVHVSPGVDLVMPAVWTVIVLIGLGLMWTGGRAGRAGRAGPDEAREDQPAPEPPEARQVPEAAREAPASRPSDGQHDLPE